MASETKKRQVFEKAKPIRGKNPDAYRKDSCGNTIRFQSYGTKGEYAWQIDHKKPKSKGGTDGLKNLQPLHREANQKKSDKYPHKC